MSAVEQLQHTYAVELIAAIKTPVVLTGNFDQVRTHFIEQLKAYDVVVTTDTLADAKKLCTELNKMATEVKGRGKVVSSEASAPIDAFNAQVKELAQLLLDARTKLLDQVKTFEDETRAKALAALQAYLIEQGTAKGIQPEFQRAKIDDLANLSTLTSTGKLSGKAKAEVDSRINADLALQQQTEMRLLKLENESYKAGLTAPLNRGHVETFLFAEEPVYQQRLAALFQSEVQREQQAQEAMRRKAEAEAQRVAEAQQRAADAERNAAEKSEQLRLQQEKHAREMDELQVRQQTQLAEQQQAAAAEAEAMRQAQVIPSATQLNVQSLTETKFAFSDINSPQTAKFVTGSIADALTAATNHCSDAQQIGVWTKANGLVAVVLLGDAAQAYQATQQKGAA
jgi:hypothetical protein